MKKFKKNQKIIAKLPNGKQVEGFYIEPYGQSGHSFYVLEFNGIDRSGEPKYKKVMYGVDEQFIMPVEKVKDEPSLYQYKSWLKRAIDLESRIEEIENVISKMSDSPDKTREERKLERFKTKLSDINAKIDEYEG